MTWGRNHVREVRLHFHVEVAALGRQVDMISLGENVQVEVFVVQVIGVPGPDVRDLEVIEGR